MHYSRFQCILTGLVHGAFTSRLAYTGAHAGSLSAPGNTGRPELTLPPKVLKMTDSPVWRCVAGVKFMQKPGSMNTCPPLPTRMTWRVRTRVCLTNVKWDVFTRQSHEMLGQQLSLTVV